MRVKSFIFIIILIICSCAINDLFNNYLVLQIKCYPNIQGLEVYYDSHYIGKTDIEGKFNGKIILTKHNSHTITFQKNNFLIKYNFSEYFSNFERMKLDGKFRNTDEYVTIHKTEDKFTLIFNVEIFYQKYQNDINEQIKQKTQESLFKTYIDSLEQNPRWINEFEVNFREAPSKKQNISETLREGTEVFFQVEEDGWSKVLYNKEKINLKELKSKEEILNYYLEGWIFSSLLSKKYISLISESYYNFIKNFQAERRKRKQEYFNKYPNTELKYKKAIENNKIILGMTSKMVEASWGYPDDINRSVGSYGVHEQWIYGDYDSFERHFLYFENDILTSWQEN